MRKNILLTLGVVIFLVATSTSQTLTNAASPQSVGFSADRLKRIDTSMEGWVNRQWINGAVGLIIRNGKIVYYRGVGYKDLDTKNVLQKDDIFRIASQTKAITSTAAMMLYEEGKFLLDDPVSKYLPAFAHEKVLDKFNPADSSYTTVPAKRDITIRDLLTHTSGIGYADIGSKEANAIYAKSHLKAGFYVADDKLLDAMKRLGALPLMHQPGEKWTYGLNVDLLGCLVEIWSGMSLEEFFRKRIFEPLGMKDSYFNLPKEKASRLVNHYDEINGHVTKQTQAFGIDLSYPLITKTYFSGGAGLSSTAYDYAVFLQMLLNGGEYNGKRLLSRNTVRMMTMNQIGDLSLDENKFGLGFMVTTERGSAAFPSQEGTYSWGGAFSTSYWVDPKEKMIVVFYLQMWGAHTGEVSSKFRVLAYQALND
ncbi:MAG TPA: serine hydrolase domain-containing protein [Puia sp.]|nr:serine hydrolase domain-containing protein [Puia sp.]